MSDPRSPRRSRSAVRPELYDLSDLTDVRDEAERESVTALRTRGRRIAITPAVAFAQFVEAKQSELARPKTLKNYRQVLSLFTRYLETREPPVGDVWALTDGHVRDWLRALRQEQSATTGRPRSAYSVQSYATHVLAALRWLEEQGIIPPHTTSSLHKPSIPAPERKQPTTITDADVEALWAACAGDGQAEGEAQLLTLRNRALLSVLLDTGVRVTEAASMRVEGVNWEQFTLRVLESKTEIRNVSFGAHRTATALRRYLSSGARHALAYAWRSEPLAPGITDTSGPLWLNRDGKPLTSVGVEKLLARLRMRAGVGAQCSPHTCRRYYITRAIQAGVPVAEIARQCGVSVEVIMRHYYSATESERHAKVRAGSPLDKLDRDRVLRQNAHGGRVSRGGIVDEVSSSARE